MGFGGISIWQLLVILAIVLVLFGTKRLRNLGGDLGGAIKGFKKAMSDEEQERSDDPAPPDPQGLEQRGADAQADSDFEQPSAQEPGHRKQG